MVKYISLGQDCLPLCHYVTNGLLNRKQNGRLSLPFDLQVSSYFGICKAINDDFNNFFDIESINNIYDPTLYKATRNYCFDERTGPYDDKLIFNKTYGFFHNHESFGHPYLYKSETWASRDLFHKDDFKNFKRRYNDRISNFSFILMIPYLLWCIYALTLNTSLYILN